MYFLDLTLPSLADNLALDEALLLNAENGGSEILRVWEWPTPAVILGAAGRLAEEVNEDACRRDGVPILRRSSGGGAVLLGSGCLLYSLVLDYAHAVELTEIPSSYRYILGRLAEALAAQVPGIEPAGTSDLALAGRKVSGNSQQRKRLSLLHHGTLLYGFDLDQVGRYLPLPWRQPLYRNQRSHVDFLTNLPVAPEDVKTRLRACLGARELLPDWPRETADRLVNEKYGQAAWTRRR